MNYFVQRLAFSILSLFVLVVITFLLSHVVPGDSAIVAAGPNAGAEKIAAVRQQMGLDKSLLTQFGLYAGKLLSGDLGTSWFTHQQSLTISSENFRPRLSLSWWQ